MILPPQCFHIIRCSVCRPQVLISSIRSSPPKNQPQLAYMRRASRLASRYTRAQTSWYCCSEPNMVAMRHPGQQGFAPSEHARTDRARWVTQLLGSWSRHESDTVTYRIECFSHGSSPQLVSCCPARASPLPHRSSVVTAPSGVIADLHFPWWRVLGQVCRIVSQLRSGASG